jgi:predicted acylesterase/phospholipase RssA
VLDWRNAIIKTEPGPGEMVIDQASSRRATLPADISQVVLVLQGGGALGAYQVGVYQALHEENPIETAEILHSFLSA